MFNQFGLLNGCIWTTLEHFVEAYSERLEIWSSLESLVYTRESRLNGKICQGYRELRIRLNKFSNAGEICPNRKIQIRHGLQKFS